MAKVLELPKGLPVRRVPAKGGRYCGRREAMNGWEAAWSFRLEEMRRTGAAMRAEARGQRAEVENPQLPTPNSQPINPVIGWWFHALKLRIGKDCFYEPDFLVQLADGTLELHEVKGHLEDAAAVKMRAVVAQYPFRLLLVTRRPKAEGGGWKITEV